ncbi:MAG: hypothetical protein U0610_18205 [bacterium]
MSFSASSRSQTSTAERRAVPDSTRKSAASTKAPIVAPFILPSNDRSGELRAAMTDVGDATACDCACRDRPSGAIVARS